MEELVDHMDGLTLPETGDDKGKQQVLEDEDDSNPCAICLNTTALKDVAILPGCDHVYCAHCIIHWASLKEQGDACCPQCKTPFSEIITYRNLDGTLQDFPVQNSGKHASRQPCHGASPAPAPSAAVAVPARKRLDPGSVSPGAPPSWSGASPTPGQQQPMGSSPSGTGRRARRNARRAALDADVIVVA
ncbi:Protein SCAF11 [Auxenochlorella protothecoides]|uniref:Protein SCAF11 n=2 Tax=Auxenochlorella protothecoides TaxID=3075 RepID=A0A087SCU5_AUXPR|nr:Protein SCAF11 [Auxenochlorella protothecoides]KFM23549.1 Protein SCAF11 [Auxenochlorella protothecoides]